MRRKNRVKEESRRQTCLSAANEDNLSDTGIESVNFWEGERNGKMNQQRRREKKSEGMKLNGKLIVQNKVQQNTTTLYYR